MTEFLPAPPPSAVCVDAHTHVFRRALPMTAGRRYTPGRDATLADLRSHLDRHGFGRAVLVQPSFLGVDNSHLLAALAEDRERLRGIAMLDVHAGDAELSVLQQGGVVGVRFNLVGQATPAMQGAWQRLLHRLASLGWHVELHREARDLHTLISAALETDIRVVVDHYGRPDPSRAIADPGFQALLRFGKTRRVWVKLSAAYRCSDAPHAFERAAVPPLVHEFGADRLLWGSDWPHTQCEGMADVAGDLTTLGRSLPDAADRAAVLGGTAGALYGFTASALTSTSRASERR